MATNYVFHFRTKIKTVTQNITEVKTFKEVKLNSLFMLAVYSYWNSIACFYHIFKSALYIFKNTFCDSIH